MSDSAAGIQLTTLGPVSTAADGEIAKYYAYPAELDQCWVRANFVSSLDGAATADGRSGALGNPGDRALFRLMRELADVVLVGAGTVRVENYSGAQLGVTERQQRHARGQHEVPPIAIVTRTAALDRDLAVFTHTEVPPLILTTRNAAADARARFAGLADVYDCSATDAGGVHPATDAGGVHPTPDTGGVHLATMLRKLAGLGLTRVLTEGGPSLLGTFIHDGLLDELCLTIAPAVVGGWSKRISDAHGEVLTRMQRRHVLSDDEGYLYTRYSRREPRG